MSSSVFSLVSERRLNEACWLAWPSIEECWGKDFENARREFAEFCKAIADVDDEDGTPQGERIEILVLDKQGEESLRAAIGDIGAHIHHLPFGDSWLRDTGPIFGLDENKQLAVKRFHFNGWGQKFCYANDDTVGASIAEKLALRAETIPLTLEGGAIECDGEGTVITSEECALNANRNPGLNKRDVENLLAKHLHIKKVIWLQRGLVNDHTDGHVDTLCRFIGPGRVLCMKATTTADANSQRLMEISLILEKARDAQDRALEVVHIPSPGTVRDSQGQIMPASYCNYYVANTTVIVPTFGSPNDELAVSAIAREFPERKTVGLPAKSILGGGGTFHCITVEQPRVWRTFA